MSHWITAAEALERLGTKPQSLYASVSRGRVRARPDPADPRRSLYSAEDVARLAGRRRGRRAAGAVAAETIRWGEPILESGLSAIVEGRLYYRGRDAVALADGGAGLEEVAGLLWQAPDLSWSARPARSDAGGRPGLAAAFARLAGRAAADLPSHGRSPAALQREAAGLLLEMAEALSGPAAAQADPLHRRVSRAWQRPGAEAAIRRALVLLADHELNASTFAARVAVSTGASLAAALLAGLATLSGPLHGAAGSAVRRLAKAARRDGAEAAVRACLDEGRRLPAFGHRLYPAEDCRAAALLEGIALPPPYGELKRAAEAASGESANIDFALAAVTEVFDLPSEAPLLLFALGRTVGWLAHAMEQVASGALIRPRALYTGPAVSGPAVSGPAAGGA